MTAELVPFEEAVARVLAEVQPLPAETALLAAAAGLILREPLQALYDVPREATSLMDGYAVRASEVAPGRPLEVAFETAAGGLAPRPLSPGECARIFTGALLPAGADAVIPQEDATRTGDAVSFATRPGPGSEVRQAGVEARAGDALLPAGSVVDAGTLSLAATVGYGRLLVGARPVVQIVSTGDELVAPGEPLAPGKIHEANSGALARYASQCGAIARSDLAPDDPERIAEKSRDEHADVFVTTGGASVGDRDFAREVLARLGGRQIFWRVAMRPGKPVLFGVIDRPDVRRQLFFGLPGNPGAAALTFDVFVRPALFALQGASQPRRPRVLALLGETVDKPEHLTFLVRGRLVAKEAMLVFRPAASALAGGSMSTRSLPNLGAVAVLPPGTGRVEAGRKVEVEPWGPVEPG